MAFINTQEILYRRGEVEQITGWKRSTIYAAIRTDKFPRPVKLGKQSVAWRKTDLDHWIADRPLTAPRQKALQPRRPGVPAIPTKPVKKGPRARPRKPGR